MKKFLWSAALTASLFASGLAIAADAPPAATATAPLVAAPVAAAPVAAAPATAAPATPAPAPTAPAATTPATTAPTAAATAPVPMAAPVTPPAATPAAKTAAEKKSTKKPVKVIPKGYVYAHPDAEYSVRLPEAPTAVTIWGGDENNPVPFLTDAPEYGSFGEVAKFKRVDPDTGDTFEVNITFVKTGREYLKTLTKEDMQAIASKEYKDDKLDNKKITFSSGSDTLKWVTVTGFTIDQANNLYYNVTHFISGIESVIMIKARYNVENRKYQEYYDDIAGSIKFTGK